MKKSSPLTVVIDMALLMKRLLTFFSIFFISFLGTSMKVYPKKRLFLLNLEQKKSRWVVMNILPERIILSDRAHDALFMNFQLGWKLIRFDRYYAYLLEDQPRKIYFWAILVAGFYQPIEFTLEVRATSSVSVSRLDQKGLPSFLSLSLGLVSSSFGFLIFLNPSILLNSPSNIILLLSLTSVANCSSSKNFISFFTASTISSSQSWQFLEQMSYRQQSLESSLQKAQNSEMEALMSLRKARQSCLREWSDFRMLQLTLPIYRLRTVLISLIYCREVDSSYSRSVSDFSSLVYFLNIFLEMDLSMKLLNSFRKVSKVAASQKMVFSMFLSFPQTRFINLPVFSMLFSKSELMTLQKDSQRLPNTSPIFFRILSKLSRVSLQDSIRTLSKALRYLCMYQMIFRSSNFRLSILIDISWQQITTIFLKIGRASSLMSQLQCMKQGRCWHSCSLTSIWKYSWYLRLMLELKKFWVMVLSICCNLSIIICSLLLYSSKRHSANFLSSSMYLVAKEEVKLVSCRSKMRYRSTRLALSLLSSSTFLLMIAKSSSKFLYVQTHSLYRLIFSSLLQMILTSMKELLQASMLLVICLYILKQAQQDSNRFCSLARQSLQFYWKFQTKRLQSAMKRSLSCKMGFWLLDYFSMKLRSSLLRHLKMATTSLKNLGLFQSSQGKYAAISPTFFSKIAQQFSQILLICWRCSTKALMLLLKSSDFFLRMLQLLSAKMPFGIRFLRPFICPYKQSLDQILYHRRATEVESGL